jgi:hypothetical protein
LDRQAAIDRTKQMHEIWEQAGAAMSQAQYRQQAQANKKRREVDFAVGDRV